ncbi:MAG TPA: hypothetical protein GX701_00520 [Clostridiales bacterium]|nr:hypothetical protein [Clostridiales bacterium]
MGFLFFYTNFIRALIMIITAVQISKRRYKKLILAAVVLVLSFIPWLLSLLDIDMNPLTGFLYQTVLFMAPFLGSGYTFYNAFSWWDRSVHFLSGILFFSFGITLAQKVPEVGLAGTLIFSFALSLALHEIWEVTEFVVDSIAHTDHQHWQKHSSVVNHQPEQAIQPPGLVDTMVDTIFGMIGTAAACIGWWIYLA